MQRPTRTKPDAVRKRTKRPLVCLFLYLAAASSWIIWSASMAAGINWYGYQEGVQRAREKDRPLFLYFHTDWCSWCKRMERETLSNPQVLGILDEGFISIRLNAESREKIRTEGKEVTPSELARRYGVRGFPTSVFLEPDGSLIGPVAGYVDAAQLRKILIYIQEKAYRKMPFEEFARQRFPLRATGH